MSKSIETSEITELEKEAIIEIEENIRYKFEILDENEFIYALRPDFYSILQPKYGWPPNNDIFAEYEDINDKSRLAICIEKNHIIGLSIKYHPRLLPVDISHLPESFENVKFLKYLVFNQPYLKNLHQFLDHLPKLEFLSLTSTRLDYKSRLFSNLKILKGLDLGYCPRDDNLIKEICKIPSLQILDLSRTNLQCIPGCFHNLSNLKIIDLSDKNDILSFPRNLKELKNLEILRIYKTAMKIIPEDIQLPLNLKEIDLKSNHFTELPNIFEDLPYLEKIDVDGEVVAKHIRKTKTELYSAFQKNIGTTNFSDLFSLTQKKTRFLKLLEKIGINSYDALSIYKDLIEPGEEAEREKKATILLKNDMIDIISIQEDLKWICENQITIENVELGEDDSRRIFKLSRLNIFIGKNNSGKTYTLKELYNKCRRKRFTEFNKDIECFYIPKSRLYNKIMTSGERKGFMISIRGLVESYEELQSDVKNWSFDKIIEIINFFNSTDEEISELTSSGRELFSIFRLILKKWLDALHSYFPDIDIKLPKRSDFGTVFEFNCDDKYITSKNYDFKELGSGMQELAVLIFFIELLKYLPQIKSGKFIELEDYHRMLFIDEPDISLHPELQEQFFKYLINASHRIQIILTTQSPFIPKPVKNYISVKLFRKDNTGFHPNEITNNNFVLVQEDLFRYEPSEIASYLSKNNYEYFKELDYKSEEFSLGSFIDMRYSEDKNYLGLLRLGTVSWDIEQRLMQNAYFLSFCPETVDLNENYEVEQCTEESLRVFIVQLGKISDEVRKELIEKVGKVKKRFKYNLRLLTLCSTLWDKRKIKDYILCYNPEEKKSMSEKIGKYLKEIDEEIIGNKSLILLPENILPYDIIPFLVKYSEEHKVVIIGGMEHCTLEDFNKIMNNLNTDEKGKYKAPIDYSEIEADKPIEINSYLNQTIVINANGLFTFQIKNVPVYLNSIKKKEGISVILKPLYKKVQIAIGNIAVLICKDLLVNSDVIDTWMDIHDIRILATPSFTDLVNPFRNKLGEIISNKLQKDKIFVFANVSEYGGSGAYSYLNRRDFEPNRKSLFPSNYEIKEEEFRHSIEGWRKKDFNFMC
ncbi:hypothetical protein LCGC14_0703080 [marine sediment metagenome]|uniref:Endonuclease GajA/Old nuclease/RecF-like AAA domain-containing protein n=1 Tax=marine sediment metagenome TaxID=412755 RepID=A0A0F9QH93_9ZZZZ